MSAVRVQCGAPGVPAEGRVGGPPMIIQRRKQAQMTTAPDQVQPLERPISRVRHVAGTVGSAALVAGVPAGVLTESLLVGLVVAIVTLTCVLLAEFMI